MNNQFYRLLIATCYKLVDSTGGLHEWSYASGRRREVSRNRSLSYRVSRNAISDSQLKMIVTTVEEVASTSWGKVRQPGHFQLSTLTESQLGDYLMSSVGRQPVVGVVSYSLSNVTTCCEVTDTLCRKSAYFAKGEEISHGWLILHCLIVAVTINSNDINWFLVDK